MQEVLPVFEAVCRQVPRRLGVVAIAVSESAIVRVFSAGQVVAAIIPSCGS